MKIRLIVAISENNAIGKDNNLIWHLPEDLKRFKRLTTGHTIVMGRNTYESIGRPLPNRKNIVITRQKDYTAEGCMVVNSIEEALEVSKNEKEVFIIGGSQIYKQVLDKDLAEQLDITLVHHSFDADTFFPEIDLNVWKKIIRIDYDKDDKDNKNTYDYSFITYTKIRN